MHDWPVESDAGTAMTPPPRPARPSLLAFALTTLLFLVVSLCILSPAPARLLRRSHALLVRPAARAFARLPLPAALQAPTDLAVAIRSFAHYEHAQQRALTRKWAAFDRMPRRHRRVGNQLGWRKTLTAAGDAVEVNAAVADELAALGLEQAKREGFSVDANDFSHFMNLGTSLLFTRTHTPNQHLLAPYVHSFSHQRTSANLLRRVSFPDIVPRRDLALRFVPGDFLELFRAEGAYNAVVTLFFIDTGGKASNLLDYLETIFRALKPGGVWINEGPLLYYGKPGMELPLEDVVRAAELVGFEVEKRDELREVRYTADELGMYTFAYDCAFWIARKPAALALPSPGMEPDGGSEL
ncbi:hypothetical protein JCM10449v2_002816 [Rhodotorula kratochvilovae]